MNTYHEPDFEICAVGQDPRPLNTLNTECPCAVGLDPRPLNTLNTECPCAAGLDPRSLNTLNTECPCLLVLWDWIPDP